MTARNATVVHRTTTTQTVESHAQPTLRSSTQPLPTLRLRAETSDGRRIQWAEDVIDNEGMGKKSSKGASCVLLDLPFLLSCHREGCKDPKITGCYRKGIC